MAEVKKGVMGAVRTERSAAVMAIRRPRMKGRLLEECVVAMRSDSEREGQEA